MKNFRYDIVKDYKFYDIFTPVVIFISKMKYKISYTGTENIPADGGYILAVNHCCGADPFIAAVGVSPRGVHFISKQELFSSAPTGWFFTHFNAFPVERGKADVKAIKYAIKLLESGLVMGIFPEGTRSRTGEFGEAKNGTVYIASKTKSDILPASLYYEHTGKWFVKTTVRYGKMIKFEDLNLSEKPTKAEIAAATEYVMNRIKELYAMGHADSAE